MVENLAFANKAYLPLILLFFATLTFLSILKLRFKILSAKKLSSLTGLRNILSGVSTARAKIKSVLFVLFLIAFVLLALRIQWGEKEINIDHRGRTILVALDISRSMLAEDLSPSRLELAKIKIKNLLPALKANRVGLLVFASDATLLCPFTTDIKSFESSLDQIDHSSVASGKTAIDKALKESVSVFERNEAGGTKLLLMFSDGEDFSPGLGGIVGSLQKHQVSLFSIGVGTLAGAPVPIVDELGRQVGHEKDSSGNVIFTKLGESALQNISGKLGGGYARVSYSGADEEKVVQFIESFEAEKFEEKNFIDKEERYFWFAGIAFLFLLFEWFF